MKDFSRLLLDKSDIIVEEWIKAVRQDEQIESARSLPYQSLRDNLPRVLRSMATMLSQSQESDIQTLVDATIEHGVVRAEQGYDAAEIAREYRLVRWTIFSILEAELLKASPLEVIRASRIINNVIDEAIAKGFKSYTQKRLAEFKQLQTQLQLTNQELNRLVRESQENLSSLAYSLRKPLNSVLANSKLFLEQNTDIKDNVPSLQHIERVLAKGRQFLHLLNDSLEFIRYESGGLPLQLAQIDVKPLINKVGIIIEPFIRETALQLVMEFDRAPDRVISDPLRLEQILTYLLSHAIEKSQEGQIKLACYLLSDQNWCIAVSDTGEGMTKEEENKLFEPTFKFLTNPQCYVPISSGLGMPIVLRLVKQLQGTIEINSQVSVGSTICAVLPLDVNIALES